jgi:hypothetical protein
MHRLSVGYLALAAMGVIHALIVLAIWAATFLGHLDAISGKVWVGFAWLWLIWPVMLLLYPERTILRVIVPVTISAALLAPCVPVLFTFTVWAVQGFAP